jgi:hypothetical protein
MLNKKEIACYVLLIICVFVLYAIPWASVFGIKNQGLLETIAIFQQIGVFLILMAMVTKLIYQVYGKPLTQETKEEKIKETDLKERKQLLFKPPTGLIIFFLFLIFLGIVLTILMIFDRKSNDDVFVMVYGAFFLIGLSLWFLYKSLVIIFTEDSVQIRSYLFYILGIDSKTVIRYADITSVTPKHDLKYDVRIYGLDSRNWIEISVNGTTTEYGLWYNPDIIAKLYLRFQEKLGDKVTLE